MMKGIDARIYNKKNLRADDRAEVEAWERLIRNALNNEQENYDYHTTEEKQVIARFLNELRITIDDSVFDMIKGMIDACGDKPKTVVDGERYIYTLSEDNEEIRI